MENDMELRKQHGACTYKGVEGLGVCSRCN